LALSELDVNQHISCSAFKP